MMPSLPKYDKYKPSNVEWLGEIPEHWDTLANKYIFQLKKNLVGKKSGDYVLLSLTLNGVIKRDMENPQGKFPAEFDTYQEVNIGDFILCLFDVEETPRTVGLSDYNGMITGAYTVMQPNENFDKGFLYYFYLNLDANKRLKPLYTGLRNTISKENFFSFKTVVPPLAEQTAIAQFLDRKTALIDQAIGIKEKQIELLKERRQILIHKAVTRGLNPNVKMKESGVEWIGEVPEHWEVTRLKYILKERNERSISGNEPLLMMSQVYGLVIRSDFHDKAEVAKSTVGNKVVFKNDLVFNKLKAHLGVFFKSTLDFPGIVSPDYAVYYSNGVISDLKYLELIFRTPEYLREFVCRTTGIVEGLMRLYTKDLFDIPMLVPPDEEQIQILNFIEVASLKIGTATSLKEKEIEKLKEYKATLINSAVTGKLSVTLSYNANNDKRK